MKALVLSAVLLFSAASSFGQVSVKTSASLVLDKPFKGANTIIVALPDSGLVAWEKTAAALTANGYTVKSSDKRLLTLSTESKPTPQAGDVAVAAIVQGSKVLLTGTTGSSAAPAIIEYRGKKSGPALLPWEQLETVAKSLGGTTEYTRKK